MPFAAACLQLRVDWGEMTGRVGVANWSSNSNPCFLCCASKASMFDRVKLGQHEPPPWTPRDVDGYEQACRRCEIDVDVSKLTAKQWENLKASLLMDSNKKHQGLSLQHDFPHLKLKKGDRVEPAPFLMDWATLIHSRPAKIRFWRARSETSVRHRNPVLDSSLGMSLLSIHVADVMHCWCLGIFQQFLAALFWKIIKGRVFTFVPGRDRVSVEVGDQKIMQELNKHLTAWYSKFAKDNPQVILTRIQDMNLDTLGGTESKMQLRAKAHETLCLLRYAALHMPIWKEHVDQGEVWAQGVALLWNLWQLLDESATVVPVSTQQVWDWGHPKAKKTVYLPVAGVSRKLIQIECGPAHV